MQYYETDVHCLHQAKIKWQQMLLSTESFFPGISTVCNNKWVDLLVSWAILGLYLFKISNKIFKIKELTGFIKIHRKWLAAYLNIWYELHFFNLKRSDNMFMDVLPDHNLHFKKKTLKNVKRTKEEKTNKEKNPSR